jgi:hypothetical protein
MLPSCVSHASRGCVRTYAIQTPVNCQAPRAQALICPHADTCLASIRMRTHSHAHAHAPHHPHPHTHARVCVRHLPRGHEHWERRRGTDLYKVHHHQHVCHRGFKHRRIEVKPPCAEQRFFSRVGRGFSCLSTRHCGAYPSPRTVALSHPIPGTHQYYPLRHRLLQLFTCEDVPTSDIHNDHMSPQTYPLMCAHHHV